MSDEQKPDPGNRLRNFVSGGDEKKTAETGNASASPLSRLPKARAVAATPAAVPPPPPPEPPKESESAPAAEKKSSPLRMKSLSLFAGLQFGPAFWTVTGVISLVVNGVLIAILLITLRLLGGVQSTKADAFSGLLGGLYSNFEKMDRAHIVTDIQVSSAIPVKFDLRLNQPTTVTLSQDAIIENALVTVQTGGLNITQARTTIVLPQGTILPILLDLTVPVDTSIPISLNVPVDIPLAETDLHEPFVGLREVIKPLYCLVEPNAVDLDKKKICLDLLK